MSNYHHGVSVTETSGGVRPITEVPTAVIGLVAWADDADADVFPLDKPVLVNDPLGAISDAGTTGTLAGALDAIADHAKANVVVVRVAEGADATERETNIIGGSVDGNYTGMKALLQAQAQLSVVPRILGIPGGDTQTVTTELVTVAQQLNGFVYASAWEAATKEDAVAYRDNFGDRELMIIWPHFEAGSGTGNAVARALGLRAKIDLQQGWHKSLSNVPVNGVIGLTKGVSWSLQQSATDAGYLNENEVTTLINEQGYRFWGSRTCSDDAKFAFEPAVRTAQVIRDTIAEAHLWAIDRPLTKSLAQDILSGINAKLREWVAQGRLIGGSAWVDPEKNTATDLESGRLLIEYDYTPVPPLEHLALEQHHTNRYLMEFAAGLATN